MEYLEDWLAASCHTTIIQIRIYPWGRSGYRHSDWRFALRWPSVFSDAGAATATTTSATATTSSATAAGTEAKAGSTAATPSSATPTGAEG